MLTLSLYIFLLFEFSNVLNFDEIREIADDLGFIVYEENDEYFIAINFQVRFR